MSAISTQQEPRFLDLCRRLLGGRVGALQQPANEQPVEMHMGALMGCPDGAFLVLMETASLAHWKQSERARGSLSTRELLRRADVIEELLHHYKQQQQQQNAISAMRERSNASSIMHLPRPSGEHNAPFTSSVPQLAHGHAVNPTSGAAGASTGLSSASNMGTSGEGSGNQSNTDLANGVMDVFTETAGLYLQTVVNEPSSGAFVPSDRSSVLSMLIGLFLPFRCFRSRRCVDAGVAGVRAAPFWQCRPSPRLPRDAGCVHR